MDDTTLSKLLIAVLGGFIGALLKVVTDYFRVIWNTFHLRIEKMGHAGILESFWVINESSFPIRDVSLYLSIPKSKQFMAPPIDIEYGTTKKFPYIFHTHPVDIKEGQLCWATTTPSINPSKVDLCSQERKDCCILRVTQNFLDIASESGFSSENGKSRAFLSKQEVYQGVIKVVSFDTKAKYWKVILNPKQSNVIEELTVIGKKKAEKIIESCQSR